MIESLKKALADYEENLDFKDEGHRVVVVVTGFLPPQQFAIVKDVMVEYNATYHPFVKGETKAFWTIPKRVTTKVKATKSLKPSVMLPKLPEGTMIHVSYGEKTPNPHRDFHMIQSHITIDVPVGLKADAQLIALDFVQGELAKRLKELEK